MGAPDNSAKKFAERPNISVRSQDDGWRRALPGNVRGRKEIRSSPRLRPTEWRREGDGPGCLRSARTRRAKSSSDPLLNVVVADRPRATLVRRALPASAQFPPLTSPSPSFRSLPPFDEPRSHCRSPSSSRTRQRRPAPRGLSCVGPPAAAGGGSPRDRQRQRRRLPGGDPPRLPRGPAGRALENRGFASANNLGCIEFRGDILILLELRCGAARAGTGRLHRET